MPIKISSNNEYEGVRVPDEFTTISATIRKDQKEFLDMLKKTGEKFKLSQFLQFHLDKFIAFKNEGDKFIESCKEAKKNGKKTAD